MTQFLLEFPGGAVISAGAEETVAVKTLRHTLCVNPARELDYESAAAAVVEAELLDHTGTFTPEDSFTLYADGVSLGRFLVTQWQRPEPYLLRLTACDLMILSDTDLTQWLSGLDGWPYTMGQLLELTAGVCGMELGDTSALIHRDMPVARFLMPITGRGLLRYIAGANAAFACMDGLGRLTFRRLEAGKTLDPMAARSSILSAPTAPITGVCIRESGTDVGVCWPNDPGDNPYCVTGNPLLAAVDPELTEQAARGLYNILGGVSYTPLQGEFFGWLDVLPGTLVELEGVRAAVFTLTREGGTTRLASTGSIRREDTAAQAASDPVTVIQGKTARLSRSVEGVSSRVGVTELSVESLAARVSTVEQTAQEIALRVENSEKTATAQVEQWAEVSLRTDALEVSVTAVTGTAEASREQLTGLTERLRFDENGLTITNSASSMGIGISQERVVFTGGEAPATVIYPNRMETSQLDLGSFSFIPRTNGNLSLRWTGG